MLERRECPGCGVLICEKDTIRGVLRVLTEHHGYTDILGVFQGRCRRCGARFAFTTLAGVSKMYAAAT